MLSHELPYLPFLPFCDFADDFPAKYGNITHFLSIFAFSIHSINSSSFFLMAVITPKTKIYGLIGRTLVHSFSRDYFNQKFDSEGIDARYLNFEIEDVGQLMEIFAEYPTLSGLNVTTPYKELVIPYMDDMDESAKAVGAVNVIKIIRGAKDDDIKLVGFNSDMMGFRQSIEPLLGEGMERAFVLGTGGASKAVAAALKSLNVDVDFVSRRKSAATTTYEELTKLMVSQHKIIVNATPVGTYPNVTECPDFPYKFLTPQHLCYDLIYNPDVTQFMKNSTEHGAVTKNGLEMLLLQAFLSYEFWNK